MKCAKSLKCNIGKWKPPMISNPNYKGKWSRRRIPNPNYFEDKEPFKMTSIVSLTIFASNKMSYEQIFYFTCSEIFT